MKNKDFDEKGFIELLKRPSTLNSGTVDIKQQGVLPKKEKE